MKVGKDWAGYVSAAAALGGDKNTSKAFGILQNMKENKRNRSALKDRNTSDIDAFHSASSQSGSPNDNYG